MRAPDARTPPARGASAEDTRADLGIVPARPLSRYAEKRFATLQAQAALMGIGLERIPGGFVVTRWNLGRELESLDAVAEMLAQMGVKP